ncbi:MAG: hypothetical protein KDG50_02980 [Chromatiales bacterium]|nr:hypothetical protein [Chromatiales bacterium]
MAEHASIAPLVWIRRVLLLGLAGVGAWFAVHLGIGDHLAQTIESEPARAGEALRWNPHDAGARIAALAVSATSGDDTGTGANLVDGLRQALRSDPAQSNALLVLARQPGVFSDAQQADRVVRLASRIGAANWVGRLDAADYWLGKGEVVAAVNEWSAALERRPSLKTELFPVLIRLANDAGGRAVLAAMVDEQGRPGWWTEFAREAMSKARSVDDARAIFDLSGQPDSGIRAAMVDRLIAEQRWGDAYLLWLAGLEPAAEAQLALLFDGGFDLRPLPGFGWQLEESRAAVSEFARTVGSDSTALHVVFRGHRNWFEGVWQRLLLPAGHYRISGRVRLDSLEAFRGLAWELRCALGSDRLLGSSERFLGTHDWKWFQFEITVPPHDCAAQKIVMRAVGDDVTQAAVRGEAWFDDMNIAPDAGTRTVLESKQATARKAKR